MSGFAHPGTPPVGRLRRPWEIFAEPYSSDLAGTSFGRLDCLEERLAIQAFDVFSSLAIPELTDCSRYSIAWSWLV